MRRPVMTEHADVIELGFQKLYSVFKFYTGLETVLIRHKKIIRIMWFRILMASRSFEEGA